MARPGDKTEIVDGVIYPSKADVEKVVAKLQSEVKSNPKIAEKFKTNPRGTLAAFGLNEDVQNELLHDMHIKPVEGEWCIITSIGCLQTCWFTACALTNVHIG
jgi:hypothetical protein